MFDLSTHKRFKYLLFSSLYFSEGLYQGLILIVTPLYLLDKGVSLPLVTLIGGIGYLPWGLKFVWGGIIDFYHKIGRKKFAIAGTIFGAIGFFTLSLIDQFFSVVFFAIFLFMGYTGVGFLDSATDAWAIDISKKEDRGKINSSMNIGNWVGQYLGALMIIIIGAAFGYNISFMLMGVIILILVIVPFSVKYERKIGKLQMWSLIKQEFKKRITRLTTLYFFIIVLQHALYITLIVAYLKIVLNLDNTFIGFLYVFWLVVVIPGSITGGVLADKYGRKLPLYIFLIALMIASITPIFFTNFYLIIAAFSITLFFMDGVISANWALVMDIINPKISASEHEIICSIVNFGGIIIGSATGTLIVLLGFNNLFLLSAIIIVIALVVFYKIKDLDKIKWEPVS
jgi:MFS family permease